LTYGLINTKLLAMTLKEYFEISPRGTAAKLANKLNISPSYLSQLASGEAPISVEKAVEIELHTEGVVTREAMFPESYLAKWPELADRNTSNLRSPGRRAADKQLGRRKVIAIVK
jgi:DNA-binding transcriptional regulator YdaS (Cro superfamily)